MYNNAMAHVNKAEVDMETMLGKHWFSTRYIKYKCSLTTEAEKEIRTFCLSLNRCCALRFFSDHACDLLLAPLAVSAGMACKLVPAGIAKG